MAEMIFYKFPTLIKGIFDKATLSKTVHDLIAVEFNGVCADFLDGFDASNAKNWMGLMKKPVEIEKHYLIDNSQAASWKAAYKDEMKRLDKEYKAMVKEIDKKKLAPLAQRAEIARQLEKNPKLRQRVQNPIQEKEMELAYNRYMEGQSIRFNKTDAHKDLVALKKAAEAVEQGIMLVKTSLPSSVMDYGILFSGILEKESLVKEIKALIKVCEDGWIDVLSTLVSGQPSTGEPLTPRQAKRVVAAWVGSLRSLRAKCSMLVAQIKASSQKLSLSRAKLGEHIASSCKKTSVDMNHLEFMYWAATYHKDSGLNTLASAYAANGFEDTKWADDFSYKTPRNQGFWTRQDKLDYPRWFAELRMEYSWTADIDSADFYLSSIGGVSKQKLFDIAFDYVKKPTNRLHTL